MLIPLAAYPYYRPYENSAMQFSNYSKHVKLKAVYPFKFNGVVAWNIKKKSGAAYVVSGN